MLRSGWVIKQAWPALCLVLASWSVLAGADAPKPGEYQQGGYQFVVAPAPAFVQTRGVPTQWPSTKQAAPRWRTWLLDSQIDRRGEKPVFFVDLAYEPIASELVGDAARYSIDFNPLYQTLTLHQVSVRRGGIWSNRLEPAKVSLARRESGFENDMADGEVTALIVLDDVRVHDVVRLSYTIEGSNPILKSSEHDSFNLAWVDPVLDRHVRVLYAAGQPVVWKTFQSKVRAELTTVGDHQELSLHAHDMPAVLNEQDYPNWYSPFPSLQVAPRRSWAEVVDWALPLYPDPGPLPDDLQLKVAEWQRLDDPYAKAMAVLRTVQDQVRYFGTEMGDSTHRPALPAITWQQKYGDCKDKAFLTATLLRQLGFQADPALVSVRQGKALFDMLPSAEVFDHVIVRLRIGDDTFWLDPTLTMQRGDLRKLGLFGYGAALPVAPGVTALDPVVAPAEAANGVYVNETFAPDKNGGAIDLMIRTEYVGQKAEWFRRSLGSTSLAEVSRQYSEYYRKRYGELQVVAPLSVEDDDPTGTLRTVEHYALADAWVEKNGQQRLLDVYAEALSGGVKLPSVTDRRGPIGMNRPAVYNQTTSLTLPDGWTLADPPEATRVVADEFQFSREVTREPGTAKINQRLEFTSDFVTDQNAAAFIAKLRSVSDAISLRLDVRTSPAVSKSDRDQRLKRLLREALNKKESPDE